MLPRCPPTSSYAPTYTESQTGDHAAFRSSSREFCAQKQWARSRSKPIKADETRWVEIIVLVHSQKPCNVLCLQNGLGLGFFDVLNLFLGLVTQKPRLLDAWIVKRADEGQPQLW